MVVIDEDSSSREDCDDARRKVVTAAVVWRRGFVRCSSMVRVRVGSWEFEIFEILQDIVILLPMMR